MKKAVLITAGVLLASLAVNHHHHQQAKAKAKAARNARYQAEVQRCIDRAGGNRAWPAYNFGDNPGYPTGYDSVSGQCQVDAIRRGF